MGNARLAEWILSLVTTPERASATVGDLLEDGGHGSVLKFWNAVLLTACALLWRDVLTDPGRMIRLALYGVFLELVLSLAMAVGLGILYALVVLVGSAIRPGTHWPGGPDDPVANLAVIAGWAFSLLAQFQVGRVLAKRSPGRELAPSIATTLVSTAIPFLIVVLSAGRAEFPTGQLIREALYGPSLAGSILSQILALTALLAGAARVRRQRLAQSR